MGRKEIDSTIILDAATNTFLTKGFNATTMTEIASSAGVTKRTLYRYFSSKDEIFNRIVDTLLNQLVDLDFNEMIELNESFEGKIRALSKSMVDLYASEAFLNLSKLAFSELLSGRTLNPDQMNKFAMFEGLIHSFLKKIGHESGLEFAYSVEFLSSQLLSMLKGAFLYPKIFNLKELSDKEQKETVAQIEAFFLSAAIKRS